MNTNFPAIWKCERLMVCNGRKQCVTHEVEVVLIGEHVGSEVAALRLDCVHVRHLKMDV